MKYIAFYEIDKNNVGKAIEKWKKLRADEKIQEMIPKGISDNYVFSSGLEGFQLFETDDPEKIRYLTGYYFPEVKFKFKLILEAAKNVELVEKMNQ
ncbi:MAG: hypothetical protein ACFFC7_25750 [Candidatus Hermodarchaeota archaeon]